VHNVKHLNIIVVIIVSVGMLLLPPEVD